MSGQTAEADNFDQGSSHYTSFPLLYRKSFYKLKQIHFFVRWCARNDCFTADTTDLYCIYTVLDFDTARTIGTSFVHFRLD